MAMNKKEKAELERLLTVSALRYTAEVLPDVIPPSYGDSVDLKNGYLFNACSAKVTEACTSSVSHGYKHGKTSSQGKRVLYSTALLAAKAMRNEIEKECAKKLRLVDIIIENEEAFLV